MEKTLGIDIRRSRSGIAATVCSLDGAGGTNYRAHKDLNELDAIIAAERPTAAAVASPLISPLAGSSRARHSELSLRKLEHPSCMNRRFAPIPLPMVKTLARQGARLAESLNRTFPSLAVLETHPTSALEFLGLPNREEGMEEVTILLQAGIAGNRARSRRESRRGRKLGALLGAVTSMLHARGETIVFGETGRAGETIHLPRPRRVKLTVLDVDGTLTNIQSPWRHVHKTFGLWEGKGDRILQRFLSGEISYDRFCALDVKLWNGIGVRLGQVFDILDSIEIRPEALILLKRLEDAGLAISMISTGFKRVAERIIRAAGLDGRVEVIANDLRVSRGRIGAKVNVSNDSGSSRSKGAHLRRLLTRTGISPIETFAVGDGPSDRELFERSAQSHLVRKSDDLLRAAELATRAP